MAAATSRSDCATTARRRPTAEPPPATPSRTIGHAVPTWTAQPQGTHASQHILTYNTHSHTQKITQKNLEKKSQEITQKSHRNHKHTQNCVHILCPQSWLRLSIACFLLPAQNHKDCSAQTLYKRASIKWGTELSGGSGNRQWYDDDLSDARRRNGMRQPLLPLFRAGLQSAQGSIAQT